MKANAIKRQLARKELMRDVDEARSRWMECGCDFCMSTEAARCMLCPRYIVLKAAEQRLGL